MKQIAERRSEMATARPKALRLAAKGDATAADTTQYKQRSISPASPPLWMRYIDSRLKQFGTAR